MESQQPINPNLSPAPSNPELPVPGSEQGRSVEPSGAPVGPPATPVVPAVQPVVQTPANPASTSPPSGSGPATADDVDVIEKEWVDAAERIVEQTADNPYQQEEAVEDLQIDYLKKRYGKQLHKPDKPAGS